MNLDNLNTDDRNHIIKIRDQCEANGGSLNHDMNDPEHRRFVKLMHNICGNHEDDFPGLHAMIDSPHVYPMANLAAADNANNGAGDWETAFGVPEVGKTDPNDASAATGYGTVVGGFQTCNLSLLTLDQNGNFLSTGANSAQAPLNSLAVQTDDSTAKTFTAGTTGLMTYSYLGTDGTQVSNSVSGFSTGVVADPVIVQPKQEAGNTNSYNPNAICIGLGRPNDLTRCDYIYNEPTENHPVGRVPLVGSVKFGYPIKTLQSGTNFSVIIQVIRTDNGGQATLLKPSDMTNVYSNFYIDPADSTTLQWNLPMQPNVSSPPPPPYNPVVFTSVPWATEMVSYLGVTINVVLDNGSQNGEPVSVFIQSTDGTDTDPIDGTAYIKPIEFVWHCLGEDTQVLMADGSTRLIPSIEAGNEVVASADKDIQSVTVTHNDHHHHVVYNIETDCGKKLVASAEHIIFTDNGGVEAQNLAVGMNVETIDGLSKITSFTQEDGGGRILWNLSLGDAPQPEEKNPSIGQFYGNGILVGDSRAKRAARYKKTNDIDWVKNNVPTAFHKDVETTFKHRTRIYQR